MSVELGRTQQNMRTGAKRRLVEHADTFQYVPLVPGLKALLRNRSIPDEVRVFIIMVNHMSHYSLHMHEFF